MNIISAVKKGDIEDVRKILIDDPRCVNETEGGLCAAIYAARFGDMDMNRLFVEKSMTSYNVTDELKRSVLFYAVESGNTELCRYYVERVGHSPLNADINGLTAFEYAHALGQKDILAYFEEYCGFKYEEGYKNPIRRGFFPDPSIVRVGGDYYMVNSSFFYFPCIPVSHSKDLINWEIIGHAITNPEWAHLEGLDGGRGYWAPDISYYKGRFYICATYRNNDDRKPVRRQMVTSAERPEGPYDEPAFIDVDGIDPSIFNDDDGKRYMLLNRGASIFQLSDDGRRAVSETRLLYYGNSKKAPEGPHIIKKDGYYYLFQAEGGTGVGHMITLSRSRSLFGVYEPCPYNPIMTYNEANNPYMHRCGHGKPFMTADGRWYIVYLGGRFLEGKYTVLGRETCLDELEWTADGWCVINKGRGASAFSKRPLGQVAAGKADGGFGERELSDCWYTLRGRNKNSFSVSDGRLNIYGREKTPLSKDCDSVILRRQESFDFTAKTRVSLSCGDRGEAGLICYYDENSFFTFAICGEKDKSYVCVDEIIGKEHKKSFETETDSREAELSLRTEGLRRTLYLNGEEVCVLEDTSYLSDEGISIGKRFTGAMVGVYCTGRNAAGIFDGFGADFL